MRAPGEISPNPPTYLARQDFECPFCGRQQVISPIISSFGSLSVTLRQCLSCSKVQIDATVTYFGVNALMKEETRLFPLAAARPAISFQYAPPEIRQAYEEACGLVAHHIGAAAAYARRALELILDVQGFPARSLADSIDAASKDNHPDRRLPRRLLDKLDYVKEIGNFALHIRRDAELTIVDIEAAEVEACLEVIEELVQHIFEEPGRDLARTQALNSKLRSANRKEIKLPEVPSVVGQPLEADSSPDVPA